MKALLYYRRDYAGRITDASWMGGFPPVENAIVQPTVYRRKIGTTKQLVRTLIQRGTSDALFDAAWRKAVADGSIACSRILGIDDGLETIRWALGEVEVIDDYISDMVNNPNSKFYIYG